MNAPRAAPGSGITRRAVRLIAWAAVLAITVAAGELGEPALPSPHILIPLLLGLAAALTGLVRDRAPAVLNRASQVLLGVLMGTYLDLPALGQTAGLIAPLAAVTVVTLLLCQAAAFAMVRFSGVDRATATLGMIAGGSAAAVASAEDLDADGRLVAFMQYLRLGLVVASTPVLLSWISPQPQEGGAGAGGGAGGPWHLVNGHDQACGLAVLAVIAPLGVLLGSRLRLPSPATMGPMLVSAVLTVSGLAHGFAPSGMLRTLLFTMIGLDVGLRFSRRTVRHLRRILPAALACTLAVSAACGALAWTVSALTHIPFGDTYLATTPGGINAVLATASSAHANLPLISSVQSLRLFVMAFLAPLLIRLTVRGSRTGGP
ncbi:MULTISPECIES: AbrB family transcriptional regulator [unclassified Streptosporangium]|uniref:AbrB family transcriptional regulator n=1 Tax=unclassified Streptosporangium TaxID=2632669 RepID=UPI002E2B7C83|nr:MULTISPECIES: AbrB family transcriptional regulator [unclassified Streptosporangium]